MLENIKSLYISKIIFSFLNDKAMHLKLIKYNKSLQKKYEITISNYKIFSGKYIIDGENGIKKVYNAYTNNLLFEGEYLNGLKNGKGIEFNIDGEVIFEGEYLNGKKKWKRKRI